MHLGQFHLQVIQLFHQLFLLAVMVSSLSLGPGCKSCCHHLPPGEELVLLLFKKYILLIMLLQLSYFRPITPLCPEHPLPPTFSPDSSCPWVILISSLASTFPTIFLLSPCLFSTYHLCYLFSVPFPPSPPPNPLLTTLHVISISMVLFLFYLFSFCFHFFRFSCWYLWVWCHFTVHSFWSSIS